MVLMEIMTGLAVSLAERFAGHLNRSVQSFDFPTKQATAKPCKAPRNAKNRQMTFVCHLAVSVRYTWLYVILMTCGAFVLETYLTRLRSC